MQSDDTTTLTGRSVLNEDVFDVHKDRLLCKSTRDLYIDKNLYQRRRYRIIER